MLKRAPTARAQAYKVTQQHQEQQARCTSCTAEAQVACHATATVQDRHKASQAPQPACSSTRGGGGHTEQQAQPPAAGKAHAWADTSAATHSAMSSSTSQPSSEPREPSGTRPALNAAGQCVPSAAAAAAPPPAPPAAAHLWLLRRLKPLWPEHQPWWPAGLLHPGVRGHSR
jgi:hypothetical protein